MGWRTTVSTISREIIVNSENLIHVFLRGKTNPEYVAVFVCRKTGQPGHGIDQGASGDAQP